LLSVVAGLGWSGAKRAREKSSLRLPSREPGFRK
jgi:hypothetical protein